MTGTLTRCDSWVAFRFFAVEAFVAIVFAAVTRPALAENDPSPSRWAVLPVYSDEPPPQDPTLLRLTHRVAESIHDARGGHVRVTSRDERDTVCPSGDGACPNDIARTLESDHVVSLVLSRDHSVLGVRVYRLPMGIDGELSVPCRWKSGRAVCKLKRLREYLVLPGKIPLSLDATLVGKAFESLGPRFLKCGKRDVNPAHVRFRVLPDGSVTEVRLEPPSLERKRTFLCVARAVEALRLPPFAGPDSRAFEFDLRTSRPSGGIERGIEPKSGK